MTQSFSRVHKFFIYDNLLSMKAINVKILEKILSLRENKNNNLFV